MQIVCLDRGLYHFTMITNNRNYLTPFNFHLIKLINHEMNMANIHFVVIIIFRESLNLPRVLIPHSFACPVYSNY